jgi:hypothetical protein
MPSSTRSRQARLRAALYWLSLGVEVLPLKPRSKHLQPGYGPCKARISDPAFARKWFLNTNANLGVVLGSTSGLIVADWDDAQTYLLWRSSVGASVDTLIERTARGYHAFFFGLDLPSATHNHCEFKSTGACMVSPSLHPSGFVYRVIHHAPIASLDAFTARRLFPFLSGSLLQKSPKPENPIPSARGLIARIKTAHSTLDEMIASGIILQPAGPNTLVGLCPFHDDHAPSLWLNPQSNLWGCNRPDCPAAGTHDVINFRALFRGISNRAAIKLLADEFL